MKVLTGVWPSSRWSGAVAIGKAQTIRKQGCLGLRADLPIVRKKNRIGDPWRDNDRVWSILLVRQRLEIQKTLSFCLQGDGPDSVRVGKDIASVLKVTLLKSSSADFGAE